MTNNDKIKSLINSTAVDIKKIEVDKISIDGKIAAATRIRETLDEVLKIIDKPVKKKSNKRKR